MIHAVQVPDWVALSTALLVLLGAAVALVASFGLLRLRSFYDRVHAPTMATTLGLGLVLIASMLLFSALESRPVLYEVVIGVFMIVSTPVTFMLLVRAALHLDHLRDAAPLQRGPDSPAPLDQAAEQWSSRANDRDSEPRAT